ncbi:MAG TPA: ABC transporter, partial [Gammaproteobacteria bacterium]|nr:ABC transporter [Gammaproteobacteria bacterium]
MISTKQLTLMADGRYLCRELDIHFQTGEVWAILGKNGVGKTTLLHNLAGLKKPTAGQVWIDNFPIDKLNAKIRAQNVAILLQENKYQFPFTVEELVSQARFPYQHLWNT